MTDYLYAYGSVGLMVQVFRSEASSIFSLVFLLLQSVDVNPWSIQVTYVSPDWCDTASSMCALDSGALLKDSFGNLAQDVLVILNPLNPKPYQLFTKTLLHEKYLAVLFTRNPDIRILIIFPLAYRFLISIRNIQRFFRSLLQRQLSNYLILALEPYNSLKDCLEFTTRYENV